MIARCAYDKDVDDSIRHPALRIILSLSFVGDTAIEKIKDIEPLIDCLNDTSVVNTMRQRWTADGIKWKIGEEEKFILKSQEEKFILSEKEKQEKEQQIVKNVLPIVIFDESKAPYQYVRGDYRFNLNDFQRSDTYIMISYCHDDKEICHQIYDSLKTSGPYQLWIDKHYTYSTSPEIVAKAIEKSDIVIMCLSNKYRESSVWRLEGEYTYKRKRTIIPVRVEAGYEPTGWLNIIIGQKECIDFTKLDFNVACKMLMKEIDYIKSKIDQK